MKTRKTPIYTLLMAVAFSWAAQAAGSLSQNLYNCHWSVSEGRTVFVPPANTKICQKMGTSLVYDSKAQTLYVCQSSVVRRAYQIAMGSNGVGKTTEGDRKTPVGQYALGRPRVSEEFGIFIPIAYPTAAQRAKGYTGGDVGIHGPKRAFVCAGFLNVSINWTAGCLAVATDDQILELAKWMTAHPRAIITIQ